MSGFTFYDTYIGFYTKALIALDGILTKAEAHAKENGKDVCAEYINAKIIDDMLPFMFQIKTVVNMIKLPIKKMTERPAEEWADPEETFAGCHDLIKKTQDLLKTVKPEELNGREDEILKPYGPLESRYPNGLRAKDFFGLVSLPNVYFHLVTAYDILRQQGVPLGKLDYLGAFLPPAE